MHINQTWLRFLKIAFSWELTAFTKCSTRPKFTCTFTKEKSVTRHTLTRMKGHLAKDKHRSILPRMHLPRRNGHQAQDTPSHGRRAEGASGEGYILRRKENSAMDILFRGLGDLPSHSSHEDLLKRILPISAPNVQAGISSPREPDTWPLKTSSPIGLAYGPESSIQQYSHKLEVKTNHHWKLQNPPRLGAGPRSRYLT